MEKRLSQLKPGEKGTIVRVKGGALGKRLSDMGAVRGALVEVVRVAPLGDPIEVEIKGYKMVLRKEDAGEVQVCVLGV